MGAVPDLLSATAELVGVRSESFAEGALVDLVEARLRLAAHLEVVRVGDNVVARTGNGLSQRLILAGHTDTVPADGNADPRLDGDTLWGLGAADMKGGLAVMLDLATSPASQALDVTYVFYAREEVASRHSGLGELFALRPDLLAGDLAILGEPTDGSIEAGCQGTLRVVVEVVGRRAHTARPWMGRNAIHRLGGILQALADYEPRRPTIDGCKYREALEAVAVEGGVAGNVVPDAATLTIGHRFAPDRTDADALVAIRSLLSPHLEPDDRLTVEDSAPPAPPSLHHPLLGRMIERNALGIRAKLGWTDVARFAAAGVPAVNFGPGDPTLAHTAEERVERGSLERVWRALSDLISTGE